MTYEQFISILNLYEKVSNELSELHDIGFDFFEGKYELSNSFYNLIDVFFNIHYNKEGYDWINWFIFETDYGKKTELTAKDENGEKICYSHESLYNFIEKNYKINDK